MEPGPTVPMQTPSRSLNTNQTAVGDYLNRIQAAGSSAALAPVIQNLFAVSDPATLGKLYDSFGGQQFADSIVAGTYSADRFSRALVDCDESGVIAGRGCLWLKAGGARFALKPSGESLAYRDSGALIEGGGEYALGDRGLHVGAAASWQGGLTLLYRGSALEAGLFGTFGKARLTDMRIVPFGTTLGTIRQRYDFGVAGGTLGYRFRFGAAEIKPVVTGGWAYYNQKAASEAGAASPLALSIDRGKNGYGYVRPSLEASTSFDLGSIALRPHVAAGLTHRFDNVAVTTRFAGAPAGVAGFPNVSQLSRDVATVDAGITAMLKHGISLEVGYTGDHGGHVRNQSVSGKLVVPF